MQAAYLYTLLSHWLLSTCLGSGQLLRYLSAWVMLSLFYLTVTPKGKSSDAGSSFFLFFSDDGISRHLFTYLAVLVLF